MSDVKQRIDKWLWAARFYKTRSAATEAINKGQITVDGQKPKPSRTIEPGDQLVVSKDLQRFEITVLGINQQRRPAREAQLLYNESNESIVAREELASRLRDERAVTRGLAGDGRPTKRQRRQIIRFRTKNPSSGESDR